MYLIRSLRLALVTLTVVLMLMTIGVTYVVAGENITLNLRDADIKDVIKAIAMQTGVNIIAEKSVSGNVSLRLKDLYYEKALTLIAKTNGYAIRKVGNTYVFAPSDKLEEGFDKGLNKVFTLQFAKAKDVQTVLSAIIKPKKISIDERINAVIISATQDEINQVTKLIKQIDKAVHQVMIECKIVEVKSDDTYEIGLKWGWGDNNDAPTPGGETGTLMNLTEYQAYVPQSGSYQGADASSIGLGLPDFGDFYRGRSVLKSTLSALSSITTTKILSNPKISALNGQPAEIKVGRKVVYGGGGDQPPQEKDTGIILKITPQINQDGYIAVDIECEKSFAEWKGSYPSIVQRSAKTRVRVKDSEEILIGGMIEEEETVGVTKTPFLGDIPLIKNFFRHQKKSLNSQELIMLIVPHIIEQSELDNLQKMSAEDVISEASLEDSSFSIEKLENEAGASTSASKDTKTDAGGSSDDFEF